MRGAILCGWLLVPAVVAAYHYGPGQQRLVLDDAAAQLRAAERHVQAGQWPQAVERYEAALALLPTEKTDAVRRTRLERAKAQLSAGRLPEAYDDLTALSEELAADPHASPELVADSRSALAGAQYFLTWLLRLEGQPRDDWEPEIEAARQNYRLLAEQSAAAGDSPAAQRHREDLEAAIRLARMDLSELQGLPLPSQCKCCKSGKCKGRGKCKGKKPGEKREDARSAGSGPPPDNRGS